MVKDFIVKTLYNVGDSFATGVGLSEPKLDSYPAKISQSFDSKLVSLARPGCCNFSISLMIDWLARDDTTNPNESFYLISTTNENRLHWLAPLQTLPAGEEINTPSQINFLIKTFFLLFICRYAVCLLCLSKETSLIAIADFLVLLFVYAVIYSGEISTCLALDI